MLTPRRLTALCVGIAATTLSVLVSAANLPSATIGRFGVDTAGADLAVRAGEDFVKHSGGQWQATSQLPSDRTRWGSFDKLADKSQSDVRDILEAAAATGAKASGVERQIGDFYASFLDTAAIEARGLAPAAAGLADIAAARTHDDIARLMARADLGLPAPIDLSLSLDEKNPNRYVVAVSHGGLALPERDFYLRDDEQFKTIRSQYAQHIERLLTVAGQPEAAASARAILELETGIAQRHWPIAERRDRDKTYNARTRAQLRQLAPEFPWDAALTTAGLAGAKSVVVSEITAMAPLAQLFRATPVSTWQQYLTYHYLRQRASVLPAAIDDEVFAFFGHTLAGQPEQRARWKRAVDATNRGLGEAVGQVYVARHFTPAAKAQMQQLVENLRQAYGTRIRGVDWMSPDTKKTALLKLATFRPKIGYPDKWRDYSALQVSRGDAFGNAVRASVFEWQRQLQRLNKPTDREEWGMSPQTVNAYYNPVFNEIVFPAAILQPPFFDPAADPAVNYGAIGGVIGHEMGHGFDDQGAKSDQNGVLRAWWSDRDVAAFQKLGDRLADQYSAFEPLPGIKVNGRLTLGENIGDLGGLTVAHAAYRLTLADKPAPVLDGFSGDQRFFLSWAQVWRTLYRDQSLRNQTLSDPHSPAMYRVNGVVRNVDAWYAAFGVQPGDALYLKPEDRVHIW